MNILIADSSSLTRRLIREELAPGGYRVIETDNGEEALRIFEALRPALVTLGVDLPRLNGFQVCQRIRAVESPRTANNGASGRLPVLFITANDTMADREQGFAVGATQFMTKPFARGQVREAVDAILKTATHDRGRVLLAEDSELTRGIVSSALRRMGLDVLEAEDGQQALELLQRDPTGVVMIISDLMMPRMDGAELCTRVREIPELADLPFIVLSAASERGQVLRLFSAGASDYLTKPFSLEELKARLRVHLDAYLLARDLEHSRDELEADLNLAQQVQSAALHQQAEVPAVRRAICYLPLGRVSGDIYDFSTTSDGALNVFLGDATGHGIGAAFMTMMVQTGLDSIGPNEPVEATMTRLHTLIYERAGDRFVTGVYVRIAPNGEVAHASAGHPPIVHVPREGAARLLDEEAGLPLGLLEEPLPFLQGNLRLEPGDRLFLYSDGLVEWDAADGEQYAIERIMGYVTDHRDDPLERCVAGLIEDARTFAAGDSDKDDVTVVALEYAP